MLVNDYKYMLVKALVLVLKWIVVEMSVETLIEMPVEALVEMLVER